MSLEQEIAGIRTALNDLLTNHFPTLKTRIGNVEGRGKLNTALILGIYGAIFVAALTIVVTQVLVK